MSKIATRKPMKGASAQVIAVSRECDICGQVFHSKNTAAAFAMTTGKLRVCDACQRAGAHTQLTYNEYIKSDGWKIRRQRALALAENHCQVCAAETRLDVHHNTYERLGHERDADLIVLCRPCHALFHDDGKLRY